MSELLNSSPEVPPSASVLIFNNFLISKFVKTKLFNLLTASPTFWA